MEVLLGGIGFGLIGALGGAALAFWWRGEFHATKGLAALLAFKLETEAREHAESLARAIESAESLEDANEAKEKTIKELQASVAKLNERVVATASDSELLAAVNRVFAPTKANSNRLPRSDGDGG